MGLEGGGKNIFCEKLGCDELVILLALLFLVNINGFLVRNYIVLEEFCKVRAKCFILLNTDHQLFDIVICTKDAPVECPSETLLSSLLSC